MLHIFLLVVVPFVLGWLVGRTGGIPLSAMSWYEASLRDWTSINSKEVRSIIDNEANDYYHLIKNMDYYTRPTRAVRTATDIYRVVVGPRGDRLELEREYQATNQLRLAKMTRCCEATGEDFSEWQRTAEELTMTRERGFGYNEGTCKASVALLLKKRGKGVPTQYSIET